MLQMGRAAPARVGPPGGASVEGRGAGRGPAPLAAAAPHPPLAPGAAGREGAAAEAAARPGVRAKAARAPHPPARSEADRAPAPARAAPAMRVAAAPTPPSGKPLLLRGAARAKMAAFPARDLALKRVRSCRKDARLRAPAALRGPLRAPRLRTGLDPIVEAVRCARRRRSKATLTPPHPRTRQVREPVKTNAQVRLKAKRLLAKPELLAHGAA